jgi:hypothetical protein
MNKIQKIAYELYLDYINNYLTIEQLSEDYEISQDLAYQLYEEGKGIQQAINEKKVG